MNIQALGVSSNYSVGFRGEQKPCKQNTPQDNGDTFERTTGGLRPYVSNHVDSLIELLMSGELSPEEVEAIQKQLDNMK